VLLASFAIAQADTIHLRGGEKLIGKIINDERLQVVIESQTLGRLKIPRDRIDRIELDPAPAAPPANLAPGQPFVPPLPVAMPKPALTLTNPPPVAGSTNAPVKRRWFWQSKTPTASTDWIQLKSGEWLRGRLYGMQNRELEFDSDELNDLKFDWKDIHQVIAPQARVSYSDRGSAWGSLRVDREKVAVTGVEDVTFPRSDLVGIAPGLPRELDYWSGRFNVGLNLRAGNTEQADLARERVERADHRVLPNLIARAGRGWSPEQYALVRTAVGALGAELARRFLPDHHLRVWDLSAAARAR
jgi:hypothetical protein